MTRRQRFSLNHAIGIVGAVDVISADPERQRHPPEVRRRLILAAAGRCIAARGVEGTTVREIAKEAGVSNGTITYHFSGIEQILAEALRQASEGFTRRYLDEAAAHPGTRDRLRYIVEVNLPVDEEQRGLWRLWLELWAKAAREPALAAVHSERHGFERAAIAGIIDRAVADGEIDPTDGSAFALEFVGMLDGLGLQAAIGDSEVSVSTARNTLYGMIDARLPWR